MKILAPVFLALAAQELWGHTGTLQGRFQAIVVDPMGWGLELSRSMHLNPVRVRRLGLDKAARAAGRIGAGPPPTAAAVRERMERLRTYRWGSYRAYVGGATVPSWLICRRVLELGGRGTEAEQRAAYWAGVEAAVE